jgi:hypothetical protein
MLKVTRSKNGRKNRSISLILAIILIIASFFCGFFIKNLFNSREKKALNEVVYYLKKYGVFDTETLELKEFLEEDISKILTENVSDDYAVYYSPEEYKKIKQQKEENMKKQSEIFNSSGGFGTHNNDDDTNKE